jgi:hypothetical protein
MNRRDRLAALLVSLSACATPSPVARTRTAPEPGPVDGGIT